MTTTTPIPVSASTDDVRYPSPPTAGQIEDVSVTATYPMVGITTSGLLDPLSSSPSAIPDLHDQQSSTSSNANDSQTAKNNGLDNTDERVLISVGSIGTVSCRQKQPKINC